MPMLVQTAIEIDAPPERVWSILVDLPRYGEWNPFLPRVDGTLEVGTPVVLHVAMKPGRGPIVQKQVCTANDPARRELAWGTTLGAPWLLTAHRIQRLEPLPSGRTRYFTADTFGGMLAPLVVALYRRDIQRGFDESARALKRRAESVGG